MTFLGQEIYFRRGGVGFVFQKSVPVEVDSA